MPVRELTTIAIALAAGAAMAWAGSQGSVTVGGWSLFALCGAVSFGLNGLAFVPAYLRQTERYYDLTGSITYLLLVTLALTLGPATPRAFVLAALVVFWAVRLGSFLFIRISRDGSDGRFDRIKPRPARFLMTWTLQGLWVFLTLSCALAAMTSASEVPLGLVGFVGIVVYLAGLAIEVTADRQKSAFRAAPENEGRFIDVGLWRWSRHPNYFGEILLWCGVAILALPALSGWQFATLVSPVFVTFLLTRVSGVPMLEARADARWGGQDDYEAYKAATPVLIPRPPSGEAAA